MGKKNLKAQLNYVVQSCFKGNDRINGGMGSSKHSDKITGQKGGKIYSWSSFHSRQDTACQFAEYVRENYPEVKNANQLTAEMAEGFLLSKASTCTTETLDCYRSNLASLGENINRTYATAKVDLSVSKIVGTTANQESRTKAMTAEHIQALQSSYKPGSTGYTAVFLASSVGCRASEIPRLKGTDIQIQSETSATVFISRSKGGRDRTVKITDPQAIKTLSNMKAASGGGSVCVAKSGSIQKSINRHLANLSDSSGKSLKSTYSHTGIHAMRKAYAQKEYDRAREQGCTRQEALDHVSQQLGHGSGRDLATLQRYIADIH